MSFLAPEASSLPRFHKPKDTSETDTTIHRVISPPRSRSSSINSTSSAKQSRMSTLLNKFKPKKTDSATGGADPNPTDDASEDPTGNPVAARPSSGGGDVQDAIDASERNRLDQGRYNGDEQQQQQQQQGTTSSIINQSAPQQAFRDTASFPVYSDGPDVQADTQQATPHTNQNVNSKEDGALKFVANYEAGKGNW